MSIATTRGHEEPAHAAQAKIRFVGARAREQGAARRRAPAKRESAPPGRLHGRRGGFQHQQGADERDLERERDEAGAEGEGPERDPTAGRRAAARGASRRRGQASAVPLGIRRARMRPDPSGPSASATPATPNQRVVLIASVTGRLKRLSKQ